MKVSAMSIPDVKLIEPNVYEDDRGYFLETWHSRTFEAAELCATFVQDNFSRSCRHTLRGLHYQLERQQGKLVRVSSGTVFDVAVDLRRSSPTFGQWVGETLSGENFRMIWIPPGFAHGFYVLSEHADFHYKCTDYYAPEHERTIIWNDEMLAVDWPVGDGAEPLLSRKDLDGCAFSEAEYL